MYRAWTSSSSVQLRRGTGPGHSGRREPNRGAGGSPLGGVPATLAGAAQGAALLSKEGQAGADPQHPGAEQGGWPAWVPTPRRPAGSLSRECLTSTAGHQPCKPFSRHQAEMPHGVEGRVTDGPESCQETARPRAAILSTARQGNSPSKPSRERAFGNGDHVGHPEAALSS